MNTVYFAPPVFVYIVLYITSFVKSEEICPDYRQNANLSDVDELRTVQDALLLKLWDIEYPPLTMNLRNIRDVLLQMAYSGNEDWRTTALLTTQWYWTVAPWITSKTHICGYGKIINATVNFEYNGKCSKLVEALDDCVVLMKDSLLLAMDEGVNNVGCEGDLSYIKLGKLPRKRCHKRGYECKLRELWDFKGWQYPKRFKLLVNKLNRSNIIIDKLLALLATASISEYFIALNENVSNELILQLLDMMTTSEIPQNCCADYIQEIKSLADEIIFEFEKSLMITKMKFRCK